MKFSALTKKHQKPLIAWKNFNMQLIYQHTVEIEQDQKCPSPKNTSAN